MFSNVKYFCKKRMILGTEYCTWIIHDQNIPHNLAHPKIIWLKDKNSDDFHNLQIQAVRIDSSSLQYNRIPKGLAQKFVNLKCLSVRKMRYFNDPLNIMKEDLIDYMKVEKIDIIGCKIPFLPGDLFDGFVNLEYISFYHCDIGIIAPNIFDGIKKLKFISLKPYKGKEFLYSSYEDSHGSNEGYAPTASLDEIKNFLHEIYHKAGSVQQSKGSMSVDVKNFVQTDDRFKDFTIQVGNREFRVHKFLLAARCPILAETLAKNCDVGVLKLKDISTETFKIILKFIYFDEFPQDQADFLKLFAAAHRLQMKNLKDLAAMKILEGLNVENALDILQLGHKYRHDELMEQSLMMIKTKYPNVKFDEGWIKDADKIEALVKMIKKIQDMENDFSNLTFK